MPKIKEFDCVEMKHRIQAELLEHYRGMSEEEIRADQDRSTQADPILGSPLSPVYWERRTQRLFQNRMKAKSF